MTLVEEYCFYNDTECTVMVLGYIYIGVNYLHNQYWGRHTHTHIVRNGKWYLLYCLVECQLACMSNDR